MWIQLLEGKVEKSNEITSWFELNPNSSISSVWTPHPTMQHTMIAFIYYNVCPLHSCGMSYSVLMKWWQTYRSCHQLTRTEMPRWHVTHQCPDKSFLFVCPDLLLPASWQNVLSPINLQGFRGDFRWNKATAVSLSWMETAACACSCPSVLLLGSGSFLSRTLTAAADNKMMECGRLIHRHIPCCSADSKNAVIRFLFYWQSPNSFLITLHMKCVCVSVKACWSDSSYRGTQYIPLLTWQSLHPCVWL